jgi:uncharacterized protein DUF6542
MTETAGAERDAPPVGGRWPMADRSLMATVLGIPPAVAIGLAAVFTAIGAAVDLLRSSSLGTVFTVCFIAGCVLAVAWVRRRGLFGPMVQPPLLVAIAVPVVVLLAGTPAPGAGVAERLLVIGAPLVNAFPIMAWGTGATLALGLVRLVLQRTPRPKPGSKVPARKPRADGERRPDSDRRRVPAGKVPTTEAAAGKAPGGKTPTTERRPRGGDAARGEGRRSGSPRPS